jgi:serine protease inhibitor ecotin
MPNVPEREFLVHACQLDWHHARKVRETSFEAAAVAYLEHHHPYAPDEEGGMRVVVRDVSTGHEHSFRIDVETGDTAPLN